MLDDVLPVIGSHVDAVGEVGPVFHDVACTHCGMAQKRRTYSSPIVGGQVMMPADLKRLHKYLLDMDRIEAISDEMRAVVESDWPVPVHKLPPRRQTRRD